MMLSILVVQGESSLVPACISSTRACHARKALGEKKGRKMAGRYRGAGCRGNCSLSYRCSVRGVRRRKWWFTQWFNAFALAFRPTEAMAGGTKRAWVVVGVRVKKWGNDLPDRWRSLYGEGLPSVRLLHNGRARSLLVECARAGFFFFFVSLTKARSLSERRVTSVH